LRADKLLSIPTSFIRSTIDFLQSSFSGFFAAKSSSKAVTSTPCAGAAAAGGDAAEAAEVAGLADAETASVVAGEATAGEVGAAPLEGAVVACPNIFDMRLVNIPIRAKDTPRRGEKPAQGAANFVPAYHTIHETFTAEIHKAQYLPTDSLEKLFTVKQIAFHKHPSIEGFLIRTRR
jgi:hypothetical protein